MRRPKTPPPVVFGYFGVKDRHLDPECPSTDQTYVLEADYIALKEEFISNMDSCDLELVKALAKANNALALLDRIMGNVNEHGDARYESDFDVDRVAQQAGAYLYHGIRYLHLRDRQDGSVVEWLDPYDNEGKDTVDDLIDADIVRCKELDEKIEQNIKKKLGKK